MQQKYFPQGVATDDVFCNRETERQAIKNSIESHEHIVIVAPRRYGKTSLIAQALKENNFPSANIDFFFAVTQAEVAKHITDGVSQIINMLLPKSKIASNKLIESITSLNPKLSFSFLGQKLEIGTKQASEKSITEILLALDQFASKTQTPCVVVFDEFQQIGVLKENHAVEASIRHAVERSQYVSYIFCGSNRHLLDEMFSDRKRPLYHLCDLMTINRISSDSYEKFLMKMAKKKWNTPLDHEVIAEILHLTQNHPYYVNALCRQLWRIDKAPTKASVIKCWDDYVEQQSNWIISDISRISLNQRKIIIALATQTTKEPHSQEFTTRAGLSSSGIQKSLLALQKLDMIYTDKNGYVRVLDPAVLYFISQKT